MAQRISFSLDKVGLWANRVNWSIIYFNNSVGIQILMRIADDAAIKELNKASLLLCTNGVNLSIVLNGIL